MKNKGFVFVVEMVSAVIILFIIFNFFFPSISFKHNWDRVLLNLLSRDIILSLERANKLYEHSFDSNPNFLYSRNLVPPSLIAWTGTENAIKKKITVACNCPDDVINDLETRLDGLTINDRSIDFEIKQSFLTLITPSDVLLIWGYKNLSQPEIINSLKNYLAEGNGIVEISDITVTQISSDSGHQKIFGLTAGTGTLNYQYLEFSRKPKNSEDIIYEAWKYLRVKFAQNHQFSNFLNYNKVIANNEEKVLLKADVKTSEGEVAPAVVLNKDYGKAAWIANFTQNGISDEGKWILISLLLWASNKYEKSETKVSLGYENSYINVYNNDFFEVYAFNLGLGYS